MLKTLRTVGMVVLASLFMGSAAYAIPSNSVANESEAQKDGVCTGVISDQYGPIAGASVVVKGTQNGVITGLEGEFTLSGVKKGDVLVIDFLGFKTAEVVYNGQVVNVTLEEDAEVLGEVVVTALGLTKQAKSVGYATTRVSTDEIERASAISPVNALQGKVAGVQINAGGASGITSSSSITIRGAKSIDKNNSPIWVIDGMIIQEAVTGNLSGTDWGSQLKNLNPADYESVTVLKGAAATALYGSRGANGAIVIVSKGGQYGKKGLGIEVSQNFEWTDVYKAPMALQNVYGAGTGREGTQGDFLDDGTLLKTAYSWGPKMDGRVINQYLPDGVSTPYVAHEDNWKALYQTGMNSTTNVAINGGTDKSSFRVSYGYTDNKGVFIRNDFSRHNVAFRGLSQLNNVFSVELGLKYGFSKALNGASQGGWDWGNNVGMMTAYYLPRNYDVAAHMAQYRDADGNVISSNTYTSLSGYLWNRETAVKERSEQSMLADMTLRATFAPWLQASIKANYNYYAMNFLEKWYPQNLSNAGGYGYKREGSTSGSYNFIGMLQSNDNKFKIGDQEFTVSAIVAAELYGNTASNSWGKQTNGGFVVPDVFAFSNSVNKIEPWFNYTKANQQTFGVSAIVNLGWADQVFLELTARNDWLSSLTYPTYILNAANNYSVFYPSANASWVFTDTFRDGIGEWFSFGKLRASIARVGMGTSAYATANGYGVYSQSNIYLPDKSGSVLAANPNLGTAFNADLKPEIQQSIEIGTDLRFFNDRLTLDLAYYKTNTFNQIMSVASVSESGSSRMLINAGNIQNQGVEVQIEGTPIRTNNWRWTIGGNFTLNRGKIISLHENVKEWQLMGGYDAAPEIWAYEGGEFGVLTSYLNGSYMSPIVYNDKGQMEIYHAGNVGGVPVYYAASLYERNEEGDRDRHILGKVEPDFTLSLNTSLSWKDFDLYIQGDGRFGGNYFSNLWKYTSPMGSLKSSLVGRDKESGGILRRNHKGEEVYNGLMLDAYFKEGSKAPILNADGTLGDPVEVGGMTYKEAIETLGVAPTMTAHWYTYNYGWGMYAMPGSMQDNTWFCLREITIGYRLPERLCEKFGANYLRLGATVRNVCYIINKLTDGLNPESISSNNPLQPMDIGGVPFYRTFALNLTVRF